MLKPTRAEIEAPEIVAALETTGNLKLEDQIDARTVVRELELVLEYTPAEYPCLAEKLEAVVDYEAQCILAALAKIDVLGQKLSEVELTGLVRRVKNDERIEWAIYIRSVLFDGIGAGESTAVGGVATVGGASSCGCGSMGACSCGEVVVCL